MKNYVLFLFLACQTVSALAKDCKNKIQYNIQSSTAAPDTLTYRQIGQVALRAYVFKPVTGGNLHPAILLFHGGAWRLGEAAWTFGRG